MPIMQGSDGILLALLHSPIFEEAITEYSAECLRQLEHLRNDSRASQENVAVLKLEASPALSNYHEIRNLFPKTLAHLDEERVGVGLNGVRGPISAVLISDDNLAI
jgi:hypothetical protein